MGRATYPLGLGQSSTLELSDLFNVGDKLRSINRELKAALVEAGRIPMEARMTPAAAQLAQALQKANAAYDQGREYYTTVYRAIYGKVPEGLAGTGLGLIPLGIAAWGAWSWLVVALAAGGIIYTAFQTLRDSLRIWRERGLIRAGATGQDILDAGAPADELLGIGTNWWLLGGLGAIGAIILIKD